MMLKRISPLEQSIWELNNFDKFFDLAKAFDKVCLSV